MLPERRLREGYTTIPMKALIRTLNGHTPSFGEGCFLAETAVVIGDVVMGHACSVWYHAVVRGDVHHVRIGDRVNVQDGAVLHCTYQRAGLMIGSEVSIGHRAIVHGCTVEDKVLIGMGAIIMDGAVIGSGSVIAAGAVVLQGTRVAPGSLYAGVPAKRMGPVGDGFASGEIERIARNYPMYAGWYQGGAEKTI
jgi:gamma-carbonic anhydrase